MHHEFARTSLLTSAAMVAFAANSLLCRFALERQLIDAPSFATVRIASGAMLLAWLLHLTRRPRATTDWIAAASLAIYIVPFTLAYLTLDAGAGALILFGSAQLTMFTAGWRSGERLTPGGWVGFAMAVGGFVYLLLPGLDAPPPAGSAAMTVAGAAWGVYSLRGRASSDPLASTARSFALTAPVVAVVNLLLIGRAHWSFQGALLAAVSGTIASALGYVVWYAAVRRLPAISAATVQLTIPVIATLGGVLLLAEDLSVRLALGSVAILGGIALLISRRQAVDAD